MANKEKKEGGLFKGVFVAYFILLFHVALLVIVGCMVLFFRGFIQYTLWIFLGIGSLILLSGLLFLRRMIREKRSLGEMLDSSTFKGRSVEVSLLGGLASLKLGAPGEPRMNEPDRYPAIEHQPGPAQLEDPTTARIRQLTDLARLLEQDLITLEEYQKAKQQLFDA